MDLLVKPTNVLNGKVDAPPSKSYTHRAIIAASLSEGISVIRKPLISGDTASTIEACRAFGSDIKVSGSALTIKGGYPRVPSEEIDVKNSGTTLRIMTAVAAILDKKVRFTGDASIRKRPMKPLLMALEELGCKTLSKNGSPPLEVEGPIKGGVCHIRGDISSQFISGLLIALPLLKNDSRIDIIGECESKPYIGMTLDVMDRFGVEVVNRKFSNFSIYGNQKYTASDYTVEGDFSSAAFILATAALSKKSNVEVCNLNGYSQQADKKIVDILKGMGADIEQKKDSVIVHGRGRLKGIRIDLSDAPDLVPICAVLGSLAEGETVLEHIKRARYKESDRLHTMAEELNRIGGYVEELEDALIIKGVESLEGGEVNGWDDHRVAMALSVAAMSAKKETIIQKAESVSISFPDFIEVMRSVGGNVKALG